MQEKEVTIYDIAKRLDLSPSTISRGLKGHFTVSLATQKKIRDTAQEMGYRSNTFAASLRSKNTQTIGVIVPKFSSPFMSTVIAGIEKVTNDVRYNLLLSQSLDNSEREVQNAKSMFDSRIDGLLISLVDSNNTTHLKPFIDKGIPVLYFDSVPNDPDLPSIVINNELAAYQITQHLINKGAKKIIHLTGRQNSNIYTKRLAGFERALREAEMTIGQENLIISDLSESAGIAAAKKIFDAKADAVFVANDDAASSCMNELKRMGVKIPFEIAIAGFNNDLISRSVEPPLTTVDNPGFKMGEIAAKNLLEHLQGKINIYDSTQTILRAPLILRKSSNLSTSE